MAIPTRSQRAEKVLEAVRSTNGDLESMSDSYSICDILTGLQRAIDEARS